MAALHDEIRRATGGPHIQDGLSTWFSRTATESLQDAERRWLKAILGITAVDFTTYVDQAAAVADGWVLGTGWTFDAVNDEFDKAAGTAADLSRVMGDVSDTNYDVTVVIANVTAGSVTISLGNGVSSAITTDGTYTFELASDASGFVLAADAAFAGSISSVDIAASSSTNQDLWYAYLRSLTYTGSLPDMMLTYWKAQP